MAIVTFMSHERKETGQTLSVAAVATQLAIEHNYKTLLVSTGFEDQILENCFWYSNKATKNFTQEQTAETSHINAGVDTGVEALIRVLEVNRTSPEIVRNYSKIVLRDRLDILSSPSAETYKGYAEVTASYVDILQVADKFYDFVLVDLCNRMPPQDYQNILQISNVVVVNLTQRLKGLENFLKIRQENEFYRKNNVMLLIGRYDSFSKYNIKNISRFLKEGKAVSAIPYNTLFFEACSEGKIIDFFLKLKTLTDGTDRNNIFVKETTAVANTLIYKVQELQMRL